MRVAASLALGVSLVLLAPAVAEPPSLVGSKAPEIRTTDWIHGDGRTTLADFRGQSVLLEFWSTSCGCCQGEQRHLQKLSDDLAKNGLEVIALTSDDNRRTLRKYFTKVEQQPTYRIAIGSAGGYAITRLPCAVLIGPDGDVILDGTGGRSFSDKEVEAAVKGVRAATPAETEARAAKRLAHAEGFVKERMYARAEYELQRIVKLCPGTPSAQKAAARLKTLGEGEAEAELDAQKEIARLVGLNPTLEHLEKRPKSTGEAEWLAKRLLKRADEIGTKTPRAAKLAREWSDVLEDLAK
jgi:thiol-disulfide isomerase/thioredoxin